MSRPIRREALRDAAPVILVAMLIFAATSPLLPLLARGADDWSADFDAANAARKAPWGALYLICAGLLATWRREALRAALGLAALAPALAWFAASCLWSPSPADAVFGFAQFCLLLFAGMAAGGRLGALGAAQAVALAGLTALAGAAAMVVISPAHAFGQQVNAGALRGLYGEKTHLAVILSLAFAALLPLPAPGRGLAKAVALAALLVGIVAAQSSIALIVVMGSLGLAAGRGGLARARYGGAALLCLAAAGLAGLAAALPAALSALGETVDLNGRLPLWSALWPEVAARPLIGHGFVGFWQSESAEAVRSALGWNARGAHSGWITALLAGGAVGAALWLCVWAQAAGRALAALRPAGMRDGTAPGGDGESGAAALSALLIAHLAWSLFEANQLMQMNADPLIAGLCLSLQARNRDCERRTSRAAASARQRNSGLPIM